jgi:hypothetical protein
MKQISIRAGIEVPVGGSIGISTSVRKYWRNYYKNVPGMLGRNDAVNYLIAMDFANGQALHRFVLRSGEVAEVRKSGHFIYIAVIRKGGRQDIIVIQPSYKEAPEEIKKKRLTKEWLDDVFQGKIKRRVK